MLERVEESGVESTHFVDDRAVVVQEIPAGRVVGDVLVVAVQLADLRGLLGGLGEHREQMRLRGRHVGFPPVVGDGVGVVIDQEQVLNPGLEKKFQAFVLRCRDPHIRREPVISLRRRIGRIIDHHNRHPGRGVGAELLHTVL